jgi:hypothetical protein
MDCRRCLGPIISAGVALLWLSALSGCAVHSFQTVVSADAADRQCPTCGLRDAEGCRCAADPQYHPTAWFPLVPQCPGKADPVEGTVVPLPETSPEIDPTPRSAPPEFEGTVVPLPDTSPKIDPTLRSAPPETDAAEHSAAGGGENQAVESSDEQDVLVVVPEPSWQDWSVPTDGQREEAGSPRASETGA